jgi:tetratricopeptide (TPR) repeat protein
LVIGLLGLAALALVAAIVWLEPRPQPVIEVVRVASPENLDPEVRKLIDRLVADAESDLTDGARHGRLGLAYEANRLWPEARDSFAQAAELEPSEMLWRYHFAVASDEAGDFEGALEMYRELAGDHPSFAPVHQRLGLALMETANFDGALAAFHRVINTVPREPAGYLGAAETRLRRKEPAAAVAILGRALEVDPRDRGIHYLLGLAYRDLGREEEAAKELALGVETSTRYLPDPLSPQVQEYAVNLSARIQRAGALRDAGRLADSARVLESCLESHPDNLTVLNNLGIAYLGLGEADRAHEVLSQALEIGGGSHDTYLILASWALETGRHEEALGHADAAVERGGKLAQTHVTRAQVLVQLGRYEEALQSMERALELETRNPQIYLGLGVLYEALNRHEQAYDLYSRALGNWPDLVPASLGLGSAALVLGRLEEAKAALAAAKKLAPDDPEVAALEERLHGGARAH